MADGDATSNWKLQQSNWFDDLIAMLEWRLSNLKFNITLKKWEKKILIPNAYPKQYHINVPPKSSGNKLWVIKNDSFCRTWWSYNPMLRPYRHLCDTLLRWDQAWDLAWTKFTDFSDLAMTNFRRVSSEPFFWVPSGDQKDYQKDFSAHWIGKRKKKEITKTEIPVEVTRQRVAKLVTWVDILISKYSNFEFFTLVSAFGARFVALSSPYRTGTILKVEWTEKWMDLYKKSDLDSFKLKIFIVLIIFLIYFEGLTFGIDLI